MINLVLFTRFISADKIEEKSLRLTDRNVDPGFLNVPRAWVDSVLNSLSLEERIAQLVMVAAYSNDNRRNETEVTRLIKDHNIGGLVFFQGTPFRQAQLTNLYQSFAKTPLIIAMDAETGPGMRLDSTIRYPSQMMLGAIEDDRLIFDMGGQIARQLKRLGVHINFAPVVDINNNPFNPVINSRSFGEDLIAVTRKSLFYMIGLENSGIMAVAKHFPGHGDTEADSHKELPVIYHSRQRLDSLELFPFRELIYNGLSGIMTAHLHIPALDARESIPSSLSEFVIDTLLRKEMGFKGLVFTDALGMRGVSNHYKPVEAAELALLAGNDVLLMPDKVPEVIVNLARKVKRGEISESIINQRCRKVLAAKYWAGLNHYQAVELQHITADLNQPAYEMLRRKLIESSLTLLQNRSSIVPLSRLDTLKVASVSFTDNADSAFQQALSLYMPVTHFHFTSTGDINTDSVLNRLSSFNLIIVGLHASSISPSKQYGIGNQVLAFIDTLSAQKQIILDLFANPYLLSRMHKLNRVRALLISYENTSLVQQLSAQTLFGAIGAGGTLPVTSMEWPALKAGIKAEASGRLKFTIPFEVNMSADTLMMIDDIINKAITEQAFPGCQVLVARKGKVVLHKSYGTQVYKSKRAVKPDDLYDMASVTKVAATTQALMHLLDENCIDIDQKLSAYLPYLEHSNKKDLIIKDILTHQSGLLPFIQFYFVTQEPVFRNHKLITSTISDANPVRIGPGQYLNRYTRFRDDIISHDYSKQFPYPVANNMYITRTWPDTMYRGIAASKLNAKEYAYSDLGFILLKQLVDSITHVPFDSYLDSVFYSRLGAGSLCFNPLRYFPCDKIAPTEDDQLFRKQLIQGYVHDPRAAMFGGIAGHAGLFGNALDLAKLFQMMLNNGLYGGERYISKETIELFTKAPQGVNGNRRGLGFDKPEPDKAKPSPVCRDASPVSYGHTGFTGTMVWVDPEYDLLYVFLSNRIYPDASNNKLMEMNVRTQVQQVIYNAILDRRK